MKRIKSIFLLASSWLLYNRCSKLIFYHDISGSTIYTDMGTPFLLFKKHISLINKEGFKVVQEINHPNNQVQICFDDGFKGIYDHRAYLAKNNISPTVFLAVELIGKEGYLNKDEILELQNMGFLFQSHTVSHQNLTNFDDKTLAYELEHSKSYLEELLKRPVEGICFPIGFFSERVVKACKDAGYLKLYSSLPGNYFNKTSTPIVYRNLVQFLTPSEFKSTLYGGMAPLRAWYKRVHYL